MDAWMKGSIQFIHDFGDGIFLIFLVLLFILMLILLKTVRNNSRRMQSWNAEIIKMTEALEEKTERQHGKTATEKTGKTREEQIKNEEQKDAFSEQIKQDLQEMESGQNMRIKQQEEELFGQVLQEYFP